MNEIIMNNIIKAIMVQNSQFIIPKMYPASGNSSYVLTYRDERIVLYKDALIVQKIRIIQMYTSTNKAFCGITQ